MPRSVPQIAQCEDYDDKTEATKPGTKREARRSNASSSRPPKAIDRYRSAPHDKASGSGYSSHTSGTQMSNVSAVAPPAPIIHPPPARHEPSQSAPKPKPILHRSESQRSRDKGSSRVSSRSGRGEACRDLNCQHVECQSVRSMQRRHSASQQYAAQYAPQPIAAPQQAQRQQQQPAYVYQYASVSQTPSYQTAAAPLITAPRPRPQSMSSSTRPMSFRGDPTSQAAGTQAAASSHAAAAYQNPQAVAWAQYNQQQQQQWLRWQQVQQQAHAQQQAQAPAYRQSVNYSVAPATAYQQNYPQRSPLATSPTLSDFRDAPTFQATYAYRPAIPTNEAAVQQSRPAGALRTYSARQASARQQAMPGAYPRDEIDSSDSYSDSSDYSEEERERHYRPRARDNRLMSSSSARRPSIRAYATAPVVPTRAPRERLLRRNPQTDTGLEYISSSDNMDSDRTACAVIDQHQRRSHTNSSRGSRRPSVSTTASSGRTKATTVSGTSGLANVIVERNGRHITYLSKRDRDRYEDEHRRKREHDPTITKLDDLVEKVRTYQHDVQANTGTPHPTAQDIMDHERTKQESLQRLQREQQQQSGSHFSSHSRQDSHTSIATSNRNADHDVIKIVQGGNVVHLPPNTSLEMRNYDDGSSTLIIGASSSSRRDSKYYPTSSSRRSSKRMSQGYEGGGAGGSSEGGSRYGETILEDEAADGE